MAFWDNWFQGIVEWMTGLGWNQRPTSAAVIAVTAVLVAILSTMITRLVTDVDALKESMQKVNEWNKRKKQAMQTADKKLWLSVKRDEERIKKMQSSMIPLLLEKIDIQEVHYIPCREASQGLFGNCRYSTICIKPLQRLENGCCHEATLLKQGANDIHCSSQREEKVVSGQW